MDKRLIIIISAVSLSILFVLALFLGRNDTFSVVNITPESDTQISQNEAIITFEFSENLDPESRDLTQVLISPEVDHFFNYGDSSITVTLTRLKLDQTTDYEIKLTNVVSAKESVIEEVDHVITLALSDTANTYIKSMPIVNDRYSISRLDYSIHIQASNQASLDRALRELSDNEISEDVFWITSAVSKEVDDSRGQDFEVFH